MFSKEMALAIISPSKVNPSAALNPKPYTLARRETLNPKPCKRGNVDGCLDVPRLGTF